jgi:hypothetical protein
MKRKGAAEGIVFCCCCCCGGKGQKLEKTIEVSIPLMLFSPEGRLWEPA